MTHSRLLCLVAIAIALLQSKWAAAAEPFRYPEATRGKGELKYINGIPVLTIEGTPEEMGDQLGALALKPATRLTRSADEFIAQYGWQTLYALVLKSGNILLPRFPADHGKEVAAAALASGWPRDLLVFSNTVLDLRRIIACSTIIVEGDRSTTGGPLFGRNLDWPPVAQLHEYTLVVISRPDGKRAFASITFPGVMGCTTGMNDAGLTIAMLDSYSSRDGSPGFNPLGIPTVFMLRRLLEECTTVDEAATLLRSVQRASMLNIAICDKNRGAVLEVTPMTVVERRSEEGISLCTNHFRSPELATSTQCRRYETFLKSITAKKYSLPDIAERMHAVNQGELTLQTMVFEPATLQMHLAFGPGPATRYPMNRLNLAELFQRERKL
jgi:isopenicillin-N N-acyltransferase like protein